MMNNTHGPKKENSHTSSSIHQGGLPDSNRQSNCLGPPGSNFDSDNPANAQGKSKKSREDVNDGWISVNERLRRRDKMQLKKRPEKQNGKTWAQASKPNPKSLMRKGNVLNEGRVPADKIKGSHHTQKPQKKHPGRHVSGIKEEIVDEVSNLSIKEIDSDDENVTGELDLEFLLSEGKKGMQKIVFRNKAYHQRNQFRALMDSAPQDILVALLNEIPNNPQTHRLDIVNDFQLTPLEVKKLFLLEITDSLEKTKLKLLSTREKMKKAFDAQIKLRETNIDSTNEELQEIIETTLARCYETLDSTVMEYVTYKAMEHIRIAHGKAYFPIVDTNETCNHLRDLEVDTHNVLMPADIKRLIDDMLIHQEIAFDADRDKFFSFVKNNQSHGRLLYTNITYWPMKNPQEYYEDFFLDSSDRILKFKSRNLGNQSGKTEAHVLIKLGLDKLPPRKSTVGHMKDYLIRTSQTKNLAAAIVAKLEKSLRDLENVNPSEDNPAIKRARTGTERMLNKFQQLVKYRNNAIRELDNKPDHMPYNDRYDMTSKVLFNMQYGQT